MTLQGWQVCDHKGCPYQHQNSHNLCNEMEHPIMNLMESQWKLNYMIRISGWRESHCKTNTSIRRKKEIQKSRTIRITVWDPSRNVNHLSKVIWARKIINEFTRLISSTRTGKLVLMMNVKVSKDRTIGKMGWSREPHLC